MAVHTLKSFRTSPTEVTILLIENRKGYTVDKIEMADMSQNVGEPMLAADLTTCISALVSEGILPPPV